MKNQLLRQAIISLLLLSGTSTFAQAPAYDDCAAAQTLPIKIGISCTGIIDYHNNNATPTLASVIPVPACGTFTDGVTPDVWFRLTTISYPSFQIKIDPGTAVSAADLAMAIYTGGCSGVWNLIACNDNGSGMPLVYVPSPSAGTVFYIRVWSNDGTATGNFRICVALNPDVSAGSIDFSPVDISPCPFAEQLYVHLPAEVGHYSIKIFNAIGEAVLEDYENQYSRILDTSRLTKGIYFLKIESAEISITRKIIRM